MAFASLIVLVIIGTVITAAPSKDEQHVQTKLILLNDIASYVNGHPGVQKLLPAAGESLSRGTQRLKYGRKSVGKYFLKYLLINRFNKFNFFLWLGDLKVCDYSGSEAVPIEDDFVLELQYPKENEVGLIITYIDIAVSQV